MKDDVDRHPPLVSENFSNESRDTHTHAHTYKQSNEKREKKVALEKNFEFVLFCQSACDVETVMISAGKKNRLSRANENKCECARNCSSSSCFERVVTYFI